jgi:tetratricopeptide (TPR) repeat protein
MRRKAYDSEPLPLTLSAKQVRQGTRDYIPIYPNPKLGVDTSKYYNIEDLIQFIGSENPDQKVEMQSGQLFSYLPTSKISIPVDSAQVLSDGTVPKELAAGVSKSIKWDIKKNYLFKNDLVIFDILATNKWKRPIYFAVTVGDDAYMNLEPYFQLEGMAYRVIPAKFQQQADPQYGQAGRVNSEIMYNNIMNKFVWGGMDKSNIYMDENNIRMTMNLRNNFSRLADQLMLEGKKDKAIKALDKCMEVMPEKIIPFNFFMMPVAESYYKAGEMEKANKIIKRLGEIYKDDLNYYFSLRPELQAGIDQEIQQGLSVISRLMMLANTYKQTDLSKKLEADFSKLQSKYKV